VFANSVLVTVWHKERGTGRIGVIYELGAMPTIIKTAVEAFTGSQAPAL